MKTRILGKTNYEISEVGLGCWQFGGDFGSMKEEIALSILQEAVDNGVTFFDTADVYGDGVSEEIIGKFLKTTSSKITVATKFGRSSDVYPNNYTKEKLRFHVEESTKRLGVKSLDLLQLHCIPYDVLQKDEIFIWLRELKQEGLIKEFGASVENVKEALFCVKQEGLVSLQVIFNIFRQKLIKELFPIAKENNIGIIVRLPLASGLLSGKYTKETTFDEKDHRNFNKDGKFFNVGETFAGLDFNEGLKIVDIIKKEIPKDTLLSNFALRWILDHDEVCTIIPGASSKNHVLKNVESSKLAKLDNKIHKKLNGIYESSIHNLIRGSY